MAHNNNACTHVTSKYAIMNNKTECNFNIVVKNFYTTNKSLTKIEKSELPEKLVMLYLHC